MVLRRSYTKLKDAKDPCRQQVQKRATKVHAQRKFAQGAGLTNSPPAMTSSVREKDKPKMNGTGISPAPVLPAKRPRTEDFLTFLCFRGTDKLPPELNHFNTPSKPDKADRDVSSTGSSKQSLNTSHESPKTKTKSNAASGTRQGRSPVLPLKSKILDKRMAAKQKMSLSKLSHKVRTSAVLRARQRTLPTEHPKKTKTTALTGKTNRPVHTTRSSHPSILKRLGASRLRAGLRSAGQLPPGSDDGIKTDRKPKESVEIKTGKKALPKKSVQKVNKTEVSEKSPGKSSRMSTRSNKNSPSPVRPPKTLNVATRPTRKTKEAATLYMEMLTKDLRSPDEEDGGVLTGRDEISKEDQMETNERKTRGASSKPSSSPAATVNVKSSKRDSITSLTATPVKEKLKRKESVAEEQSSDKKRSSARKQSTVEEDNKKAESSATTVTRRTRSNTLLESEDETPPPLPPMPVVKIPPTKAKSTVKTAVKSDIKGNNKLSQGKGKTAVKKVVGSSEVESSQETDKETKITRSKSQRKTTQNEEEESLPRSKSPVKKTQPVKQEAKTVRVTRSSTIEEDQPEQAKKSGKRKPVKEMDSQDSELPKRTRRSKKETESDEDEEPEEKEKDVKTVRKAPTKSDENRGVSPVRKGKKVQVKAKEDVKEETARRGRSSKKLEPEEAQKEKPVVEEEESKRKKPEIVKEADVKKEGKKVLRRGKETSEESGDDSVSEKDFGPSKTDKRQKSSPAKSEKSTRAARKSRKAAKSDSDDSESEDVSYSRRSSRRIAMKYNEESDSSEEEPVILDRPKRSSRAVVHLYDVNSDSEDDFLTDNEDEEEYMEPVKEESVAGKANKTKKSEIVEEVQEDVPSVETKPDTVSGDVEAPAVDKMDQKKNREVNLSEKQVKESKVETSQKEVDSKLNVSQPKVDKPVGVEAGTQMSQESDAVEKNEKLFKEEPPRTRRRISREERPPTPPPQPPTTVSACVTPALSSQIDDKPVEQPKTTAHKKSQDAKVETIPQVSKDGGYNDFDTLAAAASLISLQTRNIIINRKSSTDSSQINPSADKPKPTVEKKIESQQAPPPTADSDASTASSESESKVTRRKRLPRRLRREPVRLQPPNRPVRSRRAKLTDSYLVDEDSFSSDRSSSPEVMPSSKRQMSKLLKKTEEFREVAAPSAAQKTPEKSELSKQTPTSVQTAPFDPMIPVGKNHPRQRATPLPARPDQIDAETEPLEKIVRKRPQPEEFDVSKTNLFNIKSISDNANVLATADIKPKQSIGDTWIQAFKNVKIPKPGQLSPAHHSSTPPFVRKPHPQSVAKPPEDLRRHAQQFPSTSSARLPNFQTLRVGHLQNSSLPKVGSQSPSRFSPGQMSPNRPSPATASPDRKSNVYLTPSKAPDEPKNDAPVPSKTLTHLQYEKRSQEFISSLKDAQLTNKYTRQLKPSDKDIPSRTSSPSLDETSKPIPEGGKHLNLPPVEYTLRKMSPITVSKKPVRVDKKSSPIPEVKPPASTTISKVEIKQVTNLELLNKMRVNMTHQEINGWMNDSTSSGIEHARDCGIFENNQCGCSFRTSGDSMRNSVSVTGLIVKDETKVDHGVVQPPVQLKELDAGNNKFTAETISTCKVDDYKEKLMSKAHKSVETKKEVATQRAQKQPSKVFFDKPPKRKPSMTEEEMCGYDFRFDRASYSRESGSDMSSPTPRDDVSVSNDENPSVAGGEQRKAIFHQRRALTMATAASGSGVVKRPSLSKSPSAFSAENESSVYAFEPDPPPPPTSIKQPFRRRGSRHKSSEEEPVASSSIAVQVNFETEKVLECSTQTEQVENDGQLFYFPIEANSSPAQVIQGVQLKLQSAEGPDQRVFMKAKLVTKPSPTFPKPTTSRPVTQKPEQKVRPLASTSTKLPVSAVQPTVREPVSPAMFTSQGTTTSPQLANQSTQSSRPPSPPPVLSTSSSSGPSKPLDLASKATGTTPSISSSPAPSTSSTVETSTVAVQLSSKVSAKSISKVKSAANSFPVPGSSPAMVDAPTFYPTEKEFQDPLEYIEQITPLARAFGMCRIVPPSTFKPECKVSDDMRFTAYNQYVHKMLHRWGPNVREMSAIKKYLATQSIALSQLPWIGGMEIDLPRLYQTVQMCGGLKEVIEKKRWAKVADAMKIPKSAQDRVTKLDDIYCKFLLPYDTLSHDERSKLLTEVDIEWDAREKRLADEADREREDSESESDSDDRDECITKGRTMPLSGFYRIARNTMAMWFKETNPAAREVETDYWKHVTTGNSHICVNSGSIDTGSLGFGFPTSKTSTTSRHPWNLKVLTNNSGSVLRSIGPVIGVTVPTLHVGMLFSACCWYRDPHGLPWIEYLHTGASKIWYCVPDSWGEELRSCMNRLLPRYCVDKPIWLASDTAMVPPDLLNQQGVSLCRTVQEPGQFVLVFPKAFTSTVCTGYLVSESVYFAQPSWLATAKSIFKDIQESCEPPVFSLEKLLFNIASDSRSPLEVLNQVLPMLLELKQSELTLRRKVSEFGLGDTEKLPMSKGRKRSQEELEYECEICRGNLFLSLVREERPNAEEELNYCLVHAVEILEKDKSVVEHCKLMVTYEEEEMTEVIDKLKSKIELKTQKKHGKGGTSTSASKA